MDRASISKPMCLIMFLFTVLRFRVFHGTRLVWKAGTANAPLLQHPQSFSDPAFIPDPVTWRQKIIDVGRGKTGRLFVMYHTFVMLSEDVKSLQSSATFVKTQGG